MEGLQQFHGSNIFNYNYKQEIYRIIIFIKNFWVKNANIIKLFIKTCSYSFQNNFLLKSNQIHSKYLYTDCQITNDVQLGGTLQMSKLVSNLFHLRWTK